MLVTFFCPLTSRKRHGTSNSVFVIVLYLFKINSECARMTLIETVLLCQLLILNKSSILTFKHQPHKMVKHPQTIRQLLPKGMLKCQILLTYFFITFAFFSCVMFWTKFCFVCCVDHQKIKFGPIRNRKSLSFNFMQYRTKFIQLPLLNLCNHQTQFMRPPKLNYVTTIN